MTTENRSIVTFLLDRSGSMESCRDATIEAFNAYLSGLQAETEAAIGFTFLQFDTQNLDKHCVDVPVANAKPLTRVTYQPRGGTPLIDAAVKTINAVADAVAKRDDKPRVVVCIQTDGEENSSTEHGWEELKALITAKQAEGWQFNFMGAGIDAYAQGARMGIAAISTMSYDSTDRVATRSAFRSASASAASFSAGRMSASAFSASDRLSARDRFAAPDLMHTRPSVPLTPTPMPAKLDLSTPTAPPAATRRRATVPDFSLNK